MLSGDKDTRDWLVLKTMVPGNVEVTDKEVEYFRQHPDEIDEITAPVAVHKRFLLIGCAAGMALVVLSKWIRHSAVLDSRPYFEEVVVDVTFEIGVALLGAGVTAYLLGILLNEQQKKARRWRATIRKRIRETE